MDLNLFLKRSLALKFFKPYVPKKYKASLTNLVSLVLTPQNELGWVLRNFNNGTILFSKKRFQETELDSLTGCKIIPYESAFMYNNKVFLYKHNRATKDYTIVFLKIVASEIYPEQIFPDEDFHFCLVKDKQNNIINCAWKSHEKFIPIFQEEPNFNSKNVCFEPLQLDDEFIFQGRRWYLCTEKGKCLLAELPL